MKDPGRDDAGSKPAPQQEPAQDESFPPPRIIELESEEITRDDQRPQEARGEE